MRRSSLLALLGCLVAGLVVLAGCGSGGSDSSTTAAQPTGKEAPNSPLVEEATAKPKNPSVTRSGTEVGKEPKLTQGEEQAEEKPSEVNDETPTASWPFFGRVRSRTSTRPSTSFGTSTPTR
jgi:hypothetical protein